MGYREFHYRWEYELESSPEELWPLVADTNRFNRDTRVPSVEVDRKKKEQQQGVARRRLRLFVLGQMVEWVEQPFEWIRPYRFGVVRQYTKGPLAEMRVLVELRSRSEGGTHLVYEVWAQPKNVLGLAAIPVQIGLVSKRAFTATLRRYDRLARTGAPPLYTEQSANFAQGGRARLRVLSEKLIAQGADPLFVGKLAEMIEQGDDISLARLRAYALADYWNIPRRTALEVCLWATRVGLLDLQWDLLCPHCRGAAQTSRSLTGIHSEVYCDSCNVDFTINFENSVELTFRPNQGVRHVESRSFCIGGPQVTPHIMAQQLLEAGAERTLQLPLEAGRYRLRSSDVPGEQFLKVCADGLSEAVLRATAEGWAKDEISLASTPALRLVNATAAERLFVLERTAWSDQAATAAEVTALQVFRDLFSNEALRPGEQISVGSLTVLFTDLRGSTQLYREIGDAPAFGRVMNHFDVLREAIRSEDGALVKTIGDAVMAVFRRPAGALRAILKAQQRLAMPTDEMRPLMLKVGIHSGPCIAVTLNERLDYFGCTVNMAARLEGLSTGGDVVISDAVHADPEIAEMLESPSSDLKAQPFEVTLKGFDEERFSLWRISPAASEACAAPAAN
ncbi:MAG TPA: adenylate/guanylate cyclase domain-containing protein [Pyrinomonadaceae bacterium]|jgi:class 3 adenylate cyclase